MRTLTLGRVLNQRNPLVLALDLDSRHLRGRPSAEPFVGPDVVGNFAYVYFAERGDNKRTAHQIEDILKLMVRLNWGDGKGVRANVMTPRERGKKLKIAYSYNMDGSVDRKLKIEVSSRCAGQAFREKAPTIVDLSKAEHGDYLVNPKKVWDRMACVLSVPIFDSEGERAVGVLSVDSSSPIEVLELDEKLPFVNMFADLIGNQIE